MKLVVMCARDIKVGAFGRPFFVQTVGAAVRSFGDEAKRQDPENQLARHPEDFELFELGSFEDSNARFDLFDQPKYIIRADMLISNGGES